PMSNLKKVLATVLAVAMLLSMGLTAGAGVFSDVKDTDDYARAINLLASLEVLKGMGDGNYDAAGTYTREQFAKILYVLMNGKDDLAAIYSGTSPFADVAADRWSAGYITWAKNAKVINGREDGLFWPTDIVTYAEAAKMFVIAMGYDSTVYTFPYGFIDKAQTLKLFDDVAGMTANGPANRGTVAQMAFNALFAEAPRFGTYAAQVGSSSTTETKTRTVAEGAFKMEEATTILEGTSAVALNVTAFNDKGQVAITGGTGSAGTALGSGAYDYDGNVDEYVGSKVVVWFRPAQSAAGTGSDSKEKIFDIQPATTNRVYDFTFADINDDDTTATKLVVDINGIEKKFDYSSSTDTVTLEGDTSLNPVTLFYGSGSPTGLHSDKYRAIDWDNDGDIDIFGVERTATAKISGIDSARVTLTSVKGAGGYTGSKDIEDDDVVQVVVASGIVKSDYVVVSGVMQYTDDGYKTIYMVTKATTLDGSKLTKASSGSYYFDGTKYKIANESSVAAFTAANVGNTYDLVMDVNGRIVFCTKTESAVSSDKWLMVIEGVYTTNSSGTSLYKSLVGYLADGTKKTFPIADDLIVYVDDSGDLTKSIDERYPEHNGVTYDDDDLFDSIVYKYGTNSSGEINKLYTLAAVKLDSPSSYSAVKKTTNSLNTTYSTSTTILKGNGASASYVEDDTVVFVEYGASKYKAFAGSSLKKLEAHATLGWGFEGLVDDDGAYAVVKLLGAATSAPKKTTDTYGFVLKVDKDAVDGDEYVYTFTVAYDGKVEDIKSDSIDADDDFDDMVDDDFIGFAKITFDGSGFVDDIDLTITNYEHIIINKVLSGALMGLTIDETNFAAGASLDYALDGVGYGAMSYEELADDVNVYQISEYPIDGVGNDIATSLANDTSVAVIDKSSLEESDDDLSYIATVIYDADDEEITDIFYYSSPVESVADTTDPGFDAGPTAVAGDAGEIDLGMTADEACTVYYVIVEDGVTPPPDADQVIAGDDGNDDPAEEAGHASLTTAAWTRTVTGLDAGTYDVYFVLVDASGNVSAVADVADVVVS
ncbi:MAG TPA: S-layer homology domain-containing protein, partial [Terriglobales bacterium]|nr:S-layer homology domain-containing protein [Terriglobales bacterium]